MRTDSEIVAQTNELARKIYEARGYMSPLDYLFYKATHPHEQHAWRAACIAQIMLTETDPEDALSNCIED